jgi:hypothetical protein
MCFEGRGCHGGSCLFSFVQNVFFFFFFWLYHQYKATFYHLDSFTGMKKGVISNRLLQNISDTTWRLVVAGNVGNDTLGKFSNEGHVTES